MGKGIHVFIFLTAFLLTEVFAFNAKTVRAVTYRVINLTKEGEIESGTAVAVSKEGELVTALHVIEDYRTITVRGSNGKEYNATLKAISEKNDLALLHIDVKGIPYAHPSHQKSLNQRIYLLSGDALLVRGRIAQIKKESFLLDTDTKQGASGGGVFDEKNNLLGILLHKTDIANLFYAADSNTLKSINEPYRSVLNKKEIANTNNYDTSYCHDKEDIKVWKKLAKSHSLAVQELHALFIGLCKKVENHDLTTDQAQYIFENAKRRLLQN